MTHNNMFQGKRTFFKRRGLAIADYIHKSFLPVWDGRVRQREMEKSLSLVGGVGVGTEEKLLLVFRVRF